MVAHFWKAAFWKWKCWSYALFLNQVTSKPRRHRQADTLWSVGTKKVRLWAWVQVSHLMCDRASHQTGIVEGTVQKPGHLNKVKKLKRELRAPRGRDDVLRSYYGRARQSSHLPLCCQTDLDSTPGKKLAQYPVAHPLLAAPIWPDWLHSAVQHSWWPGAAPSGCLSFFCLQSYPPLLCLMEWQVCLTE